MGKGQRPRNGFLNGLISHGGVPDRSCCMDMKIVEDFSSYNLHAVADGELTPAERAEVLSAVWQQDPRGVRELYELLHLKSLVQAAYPMSDSGKEG